MSIDLTPAITAIQDGLAILQNEVAALQTDETLIVAENALLIALQTKQENDASIALLLAYAQYYEIVPPTADLTFPFSLKSALVGGNENIARLQAAFVVAGFVITITLV